MTKDRYTELREIYLYGELTAEETGELLTLVKDRPSDEYVDRMAKHLRDRLVYFERVEASQKAQEERWRAEAEEMQGYFDKWRSMGATSRELGIYQIWEYEGEEFFRWRSGDRTAKILAEAREVDFGKGAIN